jgi:hypothetical protein
MSIRDQLQKIADTGSKRTEGIDYASIALLLVKPPSRVLSSHRIKNKAEHTKLLEIAFKKQCLIYFASVAHRDGKYYAAQPWILDLDSINALCEIDDTPKVEIKKEERGKKAEDIAPLTLYCPYCDHPINSTPGRTLHIKSRHPDKLEDYKKWLKSHGKK